MTILSRPSRICCCPGRLSSLRGSRGRKARKGRRALRDPPVLTAKTAPVESEAQGVLADRRVKTGRRAPLVPTVMMVRPRIRWQSLLGSLARKPNGLTPSWEKKALGVLLVLMVPTELKVPEVRRANAGLKVRRGRLVRKVNEANRGSPRSCW